MTTSHLITNDWRAVGTGVMVSEILSDETHSEGVRIQRVRFLQPGSFSLEAERGHIVSVTHGAGRISSAIERPLRFNTGFNTFLPVGADAVISTTKATDIVIVSANERQVPGQRLLVRDEELLSKYDENQQRPRWMEAPRYLSRRLFVYADSCLVSRAGRPISWFHTSVFGPKSDPSDSDILRLSYNFRTEINVCYGIDGLAAVRFADHPYSDNAQSWSKWHRLDGDCSYYLNETDDGTDIEWVGESDGTKSPLRNRHELDISRGRLDLYCLFDPAPVGVEKHAGGRYTEYGDPEQYIKTEAYHSYLARLKAYDHRVDELSLMKAVLPSDELVATPQWKHFAEDRTD